MSNRRYITDKENIYSSTCMQALEQAYCSGCSAAVVSRGLGARIMSRIYHGGKQAVYTATMGAMLAQNMVVPAYGGTITVASGVTSSNLSAGSGVRVDVYGTTLDTKVYSLGREHVYDGGTTHNTTLYGGAQQLYFGAVASGTLVSSGGVQQVRSGGIADHTIINSGGMQAVSSGGAAEYITMNAGAQQVISSGGSATFAAVGSDAVQQVYGIANSAQINNGGVQQVYSGGRANTAQINFSGVQHISSGALAQYAVVNAGGSQNVSSGGFALSALVNSGGKQELLSGASAFGTRLSGGTQNILAGGRAYDTLVSGGTMNIFLGGAASNTTLNGGVQNIEIAGSASGVSLNNGAVQQVKSGGYAYQTTVNASGIQNVSSGGYAGTAVINAGGLQHVVSGGAAVGTTLYNGTMNIYQGATINGVTANGGTININGNPTLQGTIGLTNAQVNIAHTGPTNTLTMSRLTAENATFAMNVDLAGNSGDKLVILSSYAGNAKLKLTNVGSSTPAAVAAASAAEATDIKLVDFDSEASVGGEFALAGGQWDEGGYIYKLAQNAGDPDYYLRATQELTDAFKTMLNIPVMNAMIAQMGMNSLQKRLGDLRGMNNESAKQGVWARTYYKSMTVKDLAKTDMNLFGAEAGYDWLFRADEPTKLYAGVLVGFVAANNIKTENNNGMYDKGDGESPAVGVYATLINEDGWFVDIAARNFWSKLDMKNHASDGTELAYKPSRNVFAASIEVGKDYKRELARDKFLRIEPKVELGFMNAASSDAEVGNTGNKIEYDATRYINAKAGVLLGYNAVRENGLLIEPLLELAYRQEFAGKGDVSYAGAKKESDMGGGAVEINAGLNMQLTDNLYWYGLGSYEVSGKVSGWGVHAGIRYAFGDNTPKPKTAKQ